MIRSNVSPMVYETIDQWLRYLSDEFTDQKKFRIHFEPAKNFGKMNDYDFQLIEEAKPIPHKVSGSFRWKKVIKWRYE